MVHDLGLDLIMDGMLGVHLGVTLHGIGVIHLILPVDGVGHITDTADGMDLMAFTDLTAMDMAIMVTQDITEPTIGIAMIM